MTDGPSTNNSGSPSAFGAVKTGTSSSWKGGKGSKREVVTIQQLYDRLPPHAADMEQALLGAMILDHRVVGDVLQFVKNRDAFYLPKHGEIFEALKKLYDEKNAGDIKLLTQLLVDRGVAEDVGAPDYLLELANATPIAHNAAHYAEMVSNKSVLRQLIQASAEIMNAAYDNPDDAADVVDVAQQTMFDIVAGSGRQDVELLMDLLHAEMEMIQSRGSQGDIITGLDTGYRDLNDLTSGLQRGEMIIIAARPSMGKTAFALNLAENVALDGHGVVVFSLEMSKQQLAQRLLCSRSEVDSQRLRRNMITKDDYAKLGRAVGELSEAPIYIDDSPGLSILELRAKARRLALRHTIDLIIVDYLQLLRGSSKESRQQEVSEMSRGIKALARELNVPVVCLSQLNRSPEAREDHRPRMADLRESGSIEQDADVVMMLHRESYFHSDPNWADENPDKVGVAELIITKQRNGPTDTVFLTWVASSTKFKDHTHHQNSGSSFSHPTTPPPPPMSQSPSSPPHSYGSSGSVDSNYSGSASEYGEDDDIPI